MSARDGGAPGPALVRIVGNALHHEQRAHVGVAQAERAEVVGLLRDGHAGELRHVDGDFQDQRPQPGRMAERVHVEAAGLVRRRTSSKFNEARLHAVSSRNMYSRARIGRIDPSVRRAGVPLVDGGVELHAGVGARPGRVGDLVPQVAGGQRLPRLGRPALRLRPSPSPCASTGATGRPSSTASMNSLVMRTELLLFWPETVRYALEFQSVSYSSICSDVTPCSASCKHALDVVDRHERRRGPRRSPCADRALRSAVEAFVGALGQFTHALRMALRWRLSSCEPVTSEATLSSSTTFQLMNSSMSGWSRSRTTIFAARRVVPPDLMAPAARSPILRKLIRPLDLPPPDSGSPSPRNEEKLRASATSRI